MEMVLEMCLMTLTKMGYGIQSDDCTETALGRRVGPDGCEIFYLSYLKTSNSIKQKNVQVKILLLLNLKTSHLSYNIDITGAINEQQTYPGK